MVSPVVGNPTSTNTFFIQPGAPTGTPTGATGLPGTSILAAPPPSLLFPTDPAAAGALNASPGGIGTPGFSQTMSMILTLLVQVLNSLSSSPPPAAPLPAATTPPPIGKVTGNAGNAGNADEKKDKKDKKDNPAADANAGNAGNAGDGGDCGGDGDDN